MKPINRKNKNIICFGGRDEVKYYAVKFNDKFLESFDIKKSGKNIFPPIVDSKWANDTNNAIKFFSKDECKSMAVLLKNTFYLQTYECFEFEEEFETGDNK